MTQQPTPEDLLSRLAFAVSRITPRWWSRPIRAQLLRLHADLIRASVEVRRMRRALDELTDDAREQAQIAEAAARAVPCSQFEVLAELDQVLGRWRPDQS